MKILVRLPNWLGDMVMSAGFLDALRQVFPEAAISVIAKKGIHALLKFFPKTEHRFIFSKEEYPGLTGSWRFGKMIRSTERFDLYFSLPDSFSSALTGFASGAKKRVGFSKEIRGMLLTHAYRKKTSLHRAEEYVNLLQQYTGKTMNVSGIRMSSPVVSKTNSIVININSEASSRRLPLLKAVAFIDAVRKHCEPEIILIGGNGDAAFVQAVTEMLADKKGIINLCGKTSLPELVEKMAASRLVLTTDSGPAHLANALGIYTIVLFGAGNERNTAPYNKSNRSIVRLGKLSCEPCVKNTCLLYGLPKCLELLDIDAVIALIQQHLKSE